MIYISDMYMTRDIANCCRGLLITFKNPSSIDTMCSYTNVQDRSISHKINRNKNYPLPIIVPNRAIRLSNKLRDCTRIIGQIQ